MKVKIINKKSYYYGRVFPAEPYSNNDKAWRVWVGNIWVFFHKDECKVV